MSDIDGPFKILVEDYTAITTSVVPPNGQKRWYNNGASLGYNASEVFEIVGNGSDDIATLSKRGAMLLTAQTFYGVKTFNSFPITPSSAPSSNYQVANKKYVDDEIANNTPGITFVYDVEDTTAGDVSATTPTSPGNGDQWTVVNSGSSGNYVTGLPNSISLGDGRTITFKYDLTNTTWRCDDVIIDEYSATGSNGETQYVKKWSLGRMRIEMERFDHTNTYTSYTFVEAFSATPRRSGIWSEYTAVRGDCDVFSLGDISTTSVGIRSATNDDVYVGWAVEGLW